MLTVSAKGRIRGILGIPAVSCYQTDFTISSHVKESKQVVDSGFHTVDSGFRRLDSGFHAYGFRIPNLLSFRIPKFLILVFIRSSEANILQFEYEVVNLNRKFICSPKDQNLF